MTSPFEAARQIGTQLAPVQRRISDRTAIEDILSQSARGAGFNDSIGQVLARVSPEGQQAVLDLLQRDGSSASQSPGGLSGQPVPPEVSASLSEIIRGNPSASADELALKLDESGIPRAFSNSFIENRRRQDERQETVKEKRFESDRSHESKRAMPFLTKLDDSRESVSQKDQALSLMDSAINEGDLSFFSKDNLAGFLGRYGEGLRTAKGAQLLNAQKEFLLGNIGRAGARPNMYIEKQIVSMLAKTGRSREANQTVVEALRAEQSVSKKRMEISDDLVDKYESELGYVPGNIASQVDKMIKPYSQQVQDRLSYNLRNIQENEMGENALKKSVRKRVTKGTPLTLQTAKIFIESEGSKEAAMKKATSLGYRIPSIEEYKRYVE